MARSTKQTRKKQKTLLIVSASFIALMLLVTVALYAADDSAIKVEARDMDNDPVYSLEELDTHQDEFEPLGALEPVIEQET
jgi:hypothetical protein